MTRDEMLSARRARGAAVEAYAFVPNSWTFSILQDLNLLIEAAERPTWIDSTLAWNLREAATTDPRAAAGI